MYEVQGGKDYQNLLRALNTFSKSLDLSTNTKIPLLFGGGRVDWGEWWWKIA